MNIEVGMQVHATYKGYTGLLNSFVGYVEYIVEDISEDFGVIPHPYTIYTHGKRISVSREEIVAI